MNVTHINDIPVNDYPIYESMLNNTLVRFSKWECAKYWESKGRNYTDVMNTYDRHIQKVNAVLNHKGA